MIVQRLEHGCAKKKTPWQNSDSRGFIYAQVTEFEREKKHCTAHIYYKGPQCLSRYRV